VSAPNPSTALATAVVDEITRHGVGQAVISPGSRSSALAIALDQHPGMTTTVVLDERSAAFRALGMSMASGRPVVTVCTSGTAIANQLPAVIEADLAGIPLVLLSADRPAEMIGVGANQTIDQVKIFGTRVRWFADLPAPASDLDQNGYWRTLVSQAMARAEGFGGRPGPVHLNIAFREPTVPVGDDGRSSSPGYAFGLDGRPEAEQWQRHQVGDPPGLSRVGLSGQRGLVIAGRDGHDLETLSAAAAAGGWVVLATAASGLRDGQTAVTAYHHLLVDGVPGSLQPDLVVTVGQIGPSDRLSSLTGLPVPQVHVDRWGAWDDPRRHATHMFHADPASLLSAIDLRPERGWVEHWAEIDSRIRVALDRRLDGVDGWTGPGVARALSGWQGQMVVASSMPIRDVDAHTVRADRVLANRGASGIDGFVATALGAASVGDRTVALSGDLSFLHDLGGFVADSTPGLVFVVIDNGGGGLFDLLPQATHAPGYERLFFAPHARDLVALSAAHGLKSETIGPDDRLLDRVDDGGSPLVLVVPVDRHLDVETRRGLDATASELMSSVS
jgi:2-succinyl-5-enolpyruvyl-6-hydroxy-3-cyclohexene-1-carboxylate synthase